MSKIKRCCFLILIITFTITSTGCWNYREINNLNLAAGIGLDKETKDKKYILTTEILVPKPKNAVSVERSRLVEAEADTVFKAMRNTIKSNGKMIYWSHCKAMIISEGIAKEGVIQVLDIIDRNPEMRPDISILIADGQSPEKILKEAKSIEDVTSYKIRDSMDNQDKLPNYSKGDTWDFISELMKEGIEPTASLVKIVYKNGKKDFQIGGVAVFKKDKMVGKLNENETEAFLFIRNQAKGGVIVLDKKASGIPVNISLEVLKAKCKMTPSYVNGKLAMGVNLDMDVSMTEVEGSEDVIKPDKRKMVEKAFEEYMKKRIVYVIGKAQQEYDSDIFGFGRTIRNNMPTVWKSVKGNWDEQFKNLSTEVTVKANITKTVLTSESIKPGE